MVIMKSKEWILAVKLEMFYSKDEILTMYFNTVDFGSNTYGIKTASKSYFNTTPQDITIEQAATLVGLLKATTTYNPRINPENSMERRNVVLSNLLKNKYITNDGIANTRKFENTTALSNLEPCLFPAIIAIGIEKTYIITSESSDNANVFTALGPRTCVTGSL